MSRKIAISLPAELVEFANAEAVRRKSSRSDLFAALLEAERTSRQTSSYLDRFGWDLTDSENAWRRYQRAHMAREYVDDDW